jgi:hypothetical protein
MTAAHTSEVLRSGIARVLEIWRERFSGGDDALYWALRLKLADADGADDCKAVAREIPAALSEAVLRSHDQVNAYFDNVRYALLDPPTKVWGTLANALRVAAGVDSVTESQRTTFAFSTNDASASGAASLATFFSAAHYDTKVAEALWNAFKPMPAADCQTLAALFNVNLDVKLDGPTVISIVRVLGNEGPLTSEESAAFEILRGTGLVNAAFQGVRGHG